MHVCQHTVLFARCLMTSHELMSLIETRRDMCMQALASDAAGFSLDPETVPDSAGDRAGDDTQLPVLRSIPGESLSLPPHYRSAEKKKKSSRCGACLSLYLLLFRSPPHMFAAWNSCRMYSLCCSRREWPVVRATGHSAVELCWP